MATENTFTEAEPRKGRVDLNEIMALQVRSVYKSKRQKYFEEQRRDWSDREIQMELLFSQQLLIDKMDKVRGNTNTMIWWLIAIPIAFALIFILSISIMPRF